MQMTSRDVLVLDQVTSFMSNDFEVHDEAGVQVGTIHTEGSGLSRFFMGSRQLSVIDASGLVVVHINDVMTFGRDRYELTGTDGEPLAEVVQRFAFFSKRLEVNLAQGESLQVEGELFDREFVITGPGGEAGRVSRRWKGLGEALLGRNRYVLAFNAGVPPRTRSAVIGAVVALDLIRAKEESAASSSGS